MGPHCAPARGLELGSLHRYPTPARPKTGSERGHRQQLGARPGEAGGAPDGEGGAKGSEMLGRRAGLVTRWQAPAGRGWEPEPGLPRIITAAAAAAAWDRGRPSCAAGSAKALGGGAGSGWPGVRGAHARVGGTKRGSEAWVRGAKLSEAGAAKSRPSSLCPLPSALLPPPFSPPPLLRLCFPSRLGNSEDHSRPALPRPRLRPGLPAPAPAPLRSPTPP